MLRLGGLVGLTVLALPGQTAWAEPPTAPLTLPDKGGPADALAGNLRGLLLQFLPDPLYEDVSHWGTQKPVAEVRWRGKALGGHPEKVMVPKNDGHWWKVRVTLRQPAETLVFAVRNVQHPGQGRMTFTAFVMFDADVDYDRQRWDEGLKLSGAGLRARLRVKLTLDCEATTRLEGQGKKLVPDAVFRLRVVKADVQYDNVVVEHVAGVGGEGAKVIGDAALSFMRRWRPSFEERLHEKANAAIVKAGDSREVRVGLSKLFGE
jgi:hypothetical protein